MTWNQRSNPNKCETILFRKPLEILSEKTKAGNRTFNIKITIPGTNTKTIIPYKKIREIPRSTYRLQ